MKFSRKLPTWHVLGNAWSLNLEDLSWCKPCIGVNRILRFLQPDALLLLDWRVMEAEEKRIARYQGRVIAHWSLKECPNVTEWVVLGDYRANMDRFSGPYPRYGNSGTTAMDWAARQLHPKPGQIVLHGMDFKAQKKRPSHFFGDGEKEGCSGANWASHVKMLKNAVYFLAEKNIRVFNGSPVHGPLDEFLPRLRR